MARSALLLLLCVVVCVVVVVAVVVDAQQLHVVRTTATNLRAKPVPLRVSYAEDDLQSSQLVFNEPFLVTEEVSGGVWVKGQALDQPNLVNGKWGPYEGYVLKADLVPVDKRPQYSYVVTSTYTNLYKRSCHINGCVNEDVYAIAPLGSWLEAGSEQYGWRSIYIPGNNSTKASIGYILEDAVKALPSSPYSVANLRQDMVETGRQMLGWYYFWGGRSAFVPQLWASKEVLTGVDCSGLVGTIYRTHGILLPRDAQPMFAKSQNVTNGPTGLLAGDLFFYADKSKPDHMFHVMMYIGNDALVESSTNSTRIMPLPVAFGQPLEDLRYGGLVTPTTLLFWGRFVPV